MGCQSEVGSRRVHLKPHTSDSPSHQREVIEARIATYPAGSVHFNLLAIRGDPLPELRAQLEAANAAGEIGTADMLSDQIHLEETKRAAWAVSAPYPSIDTFAHVDRSSRIL